MIKFMSSTNTRFFWVMIALVISAFTVAIVGGLILVNRFDYLSTQREETQVENGIHGRLAEVEKTITGQAIWDDAVLYLDNVYNHDWASQNIGTFFSQSHGFESIFILNSDNQPIFSSQFSKNTPLALYVAFKQQSDALVRSVRTKEIDINAVSHRGRTKQIMGATVQESAIVDVDHKIYILTATLVQPDFGLATLKSPHAPIIISAMPINRKFLEAFADRYMLEGVAFKLGAASRGNQMAQVALRDRAGKIVATILWQPQNPGWSMAQAVGPPILLMLFLLAVFVIILLRKGHHITQGLVASEARATHLAYYDALTGHPNRVLFFDRLGQALNQLRRNDTALAVHCIDLDRFKEINDTFGHQVGDELIYQASRRMAGVCRATETFARLSGDEFAIVQPNATAAGAARLAARICEAMSEPFDLGSGRIYGACSIGITIVTDANLDPGEALRQSDLALYRAKQTAKGLFSFFEGDMDAAVKTRRELETDLRDALANEDLYLVYQPQASSKGVMSGVEALIRWDHPTRGLISPAFFIPIAEQSGLIMQLGMFALRRAFEDSVRWKNLKIAVNVSATQIRMKEFVADVRKLVKQHNVNPAQFELEITEGILLGDDPETQDRLAELRAMGFSLALDDFGTGYSSLSYLQRYPIDKIKIDRSFIANLGVEDEANALVGAIVKLARALKLSVIAEGVETEDQLAHLSALGCSDVQGFLFSKPVSANEIDSLVASKENFLVH